MSPETLSATAAVILSLLFSYIPGLSDAYGAYSKTGKRLIMLGLLALTSLGAFILACAGVGELLGISFTCDEAGAVVLLQAFGAAVIANQAAYLISPKPEDKSKVEKLTELRPDRPWDLVQEPEPRPDYPGKPQPGRPQPGMGSPRKERETEPGRSQPGVGSPRKDSGRSRG